MSAEQLLQTPTDEADISSDNGKTYQALAAVIVFNIIVAAMLLCPAIPHRVRVVIDNLTQSIGPLLAFFWCLSSVISCKIKNRRREPTDRPTVLPAFCLGMAALCFAVGQCIWSYYELVLKIATPFPSWADAGYLWAYPFLFVGVLSLPSQPVSATRRLVVLFEGLMFMAGATTFSWCYVMGPTLLQSGETMVARVLGTAYPLSDIGLLSCLLLLIIRAGSGKLKTIAILLGVGLGSIVAIDTVFDFQTLANSYATGRVIDLGWTFGYMLVAVAGQATLNIKSRNKETARPQKVPGRTFKWTSMLQLAELRPVLVQYSVVLLVGILVMESSRRGFDHRLQFGLHIGSGCVVILLLLRQYFMLQENKDLTKRLVSLTENLESVVALRTRELAAKTDQLTALQTLTTAVNQTLDTADVISAATTHTRSVLNSSAVVIWLCDGASTAINQVPTGCAGVSEDSPVVVQAGLCDLNTQVSDVMVEGAEISTYKLLQAPLNSHGVLLGKIGVIRDGRSFTEHECQILESISLHVATALDNARQYWRARDAADRDPVTELLNHRAIHEYLDTAIDLQSSFEEPLAVILADIDNFHMFNDTYGHPVGDDVLQKIGKIIDSTLSAPSKVGRYRGDEFILVLPGFDSAGAVALAQTLQQSICALDLKYGEDDRSIPTSLSFGIASFPLDSSDRQDLLITAGNNLNSAKNSDAHIVALSEMQRAHRELRVSSSFRMLDGMVTAVDNKDRYTRRHSEDVTDFALWIADELGLSVDHKQILRTGALLHDVGKIGVPDEILHKPGRLDEEEYNVMKQHPTLGALIVGGVAGMDNIVDVVKYHHEHWDGTGYPEGLAGELIPYNARLVAVADAMSAMTTDRPYRKGMSFNVALGRIEDGMGTQFDPDLAAAFLKIARKRLTSAKNVSLDTKTTAKAA